MKDIAFHITDLAENSIRAGANRIGISLHLEAGILRLIVTDDGCGMDEATLRKVTDPFYTTRTTRRMGLGLPFLFHNTKQCGGNAEIHSRPGEGTQVKAWLPLGNIDCPPMGDLPTTLMLLMAGNPAVDVTISFACGENEFSLSTHEVTEALGDLPAGHPKAASLLAEIISENLAEVFGAGME